MLHMHLIQLVRFDIMKRLLVILLHLSDVIGSDLLHLADPTHNTVKQQNFVEIKFCECLTFAF